MKTKFILFTLMIAGLVSACADDPKKPEPPVFSVSPTTEATFTAPGTESHSYTVTTDQPTWDVTVEQGQDWCIVTESTEGFTVTATPNMDAAVRTADISVTAGELEPIVITATQTGHAGTDAFWGFITRDGETKEVARAGFYHSQSETVDFYRLNISPENIEGVEIGEQMEMLEIEIPAAMLNREIDLSAGPHAASGAYLYIGSRADFSDYDVYVNEASTGTMRVGVDEQTHSFTVELTDVKLHDGTIVSCEASGIIANEQTDKFDGSFHGTTDYAVTGNASKPYTFSTAELYFVRTLNSLGVPVTELHFSAEEGEEVTALNQTRKEWAYSFSILLDHPQMNLTPGSYTMAWSEYDFMTGEMVEVVPASPDGLNIAFGSKHSMSQYVADRNGDGDTSDADILFKGGGIQQGTIEIEVSERYLKVALKGDVKNEYNQTIPASEFIFDYTNK